MHTLPFFLMNGSGQVQIHESVSIDWYDGPVSGFIRCPVTQQSFVFEFASYPVADHSSRRYNLKMIETDLFEDIISYLSKHQTPRFPIWFFSLSHEQCKAIGLDLELRKWKSHYESEPFMYTMDWDLENNIVRKVAEIQDF